MGASGQIGENIAEIFFIYKLIPFLSNSPTGQTVHHIITLNGSNDADSRNGVPFCLSLILHPILGIKLPKNTTFGASIGIFQPNVSNIEMFML